MQIRGLHRTIYRGARLASRLEAQERSDEAERRDALARWHQARRDGLTAGKAAAAVAVPLSTLYRWQKRCQPKSTGPHSVRKSKRDSKLVLAVERLRKQYAMWGKDKLRKGHCQPGCTRYRAGRSGHAQRVANIPAQSSKAICHAAS